MKEDYSKQSNNTQKRSSTLLTQLSKLIKTFQFQTMYNIMKGSNTFWAINILLYLIKTLQFTQLMFRSKLFYLWKKPQFTQTIKQILDIFHLQTKNKGTPPPSLFIYYYNYIYISIRFQRLHPNVHSTISLHLHSAPIFPYPNTKNFPKIAKYSKFPSKHLKNLRKFPPANPLLSHPRLPSPDLQMPTTQANRLPRRPMQPRSPQHNDNLQHSLPNLLLLLHLPLHNPRLRNPYKNQRLNQPANRKIRAYLLLLRNLPYILPKFPPKHRNLLSFIPFRHLLPLLHPSFQHKQLQHIHRKDNNNSPCP